MGVGACGLDKPFPVGLEMLVRSEIWKCICQDVKYIEVSEVDLC